MRVPPAITNKISKYLIGKSKKQNRRTSNSNTEKTCFVSSVNDADNNQSAATTE